MKQGREGRFHFNSEKTNSIRRQGSGLNFLKSVTRWQSWAFLPSFSGRGVCS